MANREICNLRIYRGQKLTLKISLIWSDMFLGELFYGSNLFLPGNL